MILRIDIFSDVVCPWCYIGKRRMEKALEMMGDRHETYVTWLPFELNPQMPKGGMERTSYLTAKFGGSEKLAEMDASVREAARQEEIHMKIDKIERSPNTRDAHRLIWTAEKEGHQDAVVEALFRAYFCEGKDVGDRDILASVAGRTGMEGADIELLFGDERSTQAVIKEEGMGQRLGIHSVPSFILNGEYLLTGAHYPETLVSAFREAVNGEVS